MRQSTSFVELRPLAYVACVSRSLLQDTDSAKRLKDLVENERKGQRNTKETPEEMQECEAVFRDF